MDSQTLIADFKNALGQLQVALSCPAENDVYKAGCIQYFEFSFELAWKTIKRIAEDEGLSDCTSPKAALKTAFSQGWIRDEELWLDMLFARNLMSHTYSADQAMGIFDKLTGYLAALQQLEAAFENLIRGV